MSEQAAGTGWRLWRLSPDGLVSLFPDTTVGEEPWVPGWNVARCLELERADPAPPMLRMHDDGEGAPARRCWCGLHVCPTAESLRSLMYVAKFHKVVLGEIEYAGQVLPRQPVRPVDRRPARHAASGEGSAAAPGRPSPGSRQAARRGSHAEGALRRASGRPGARRVAPGAVQVRRTA